ncbi:MAG: dihydrodipicolinate reductase [Verrucomicrobiae bacterium]|nr:dihydrodipicolinate reductase [Verrucomicrobiae bacterium]
MTKPLRVVQVGLGDIGRAAARLVLEKPHLQLVGAVDPKFVGRPLMEVLDWPYRLEGVVTHHIPAADVAIHCTTSRWETAADELAALVRLGMHCVTSCEQALLPDQHDTARAAELDRLCREHRVSVVGTGVNPGFVMDTLPALLTAACQRVHSIHVRRVVDVATRRPALQRKVGAGLTPAEFDAQLAAGTLRHVGLTDSLLFVARAIGWEDVDVSEKIEPVLGADGRVAGVRQVAHAPNLVWELEMYRGAPEPRDEIHIEGVPPIHLVIRNGVAGDLATPAMLVNIIPQLLAAPPGLHTMAELCLPHFA